MYTKEIVEVDGNGGIKFNLFPKQAQFVHSDIDDIFFGGSVGGGKSISLLCWAAMRRLQFANSTGILFRRTFRELEGSLILRSKEVYPKLGAVYNENKKVWRFPNGSMQFFGFAEADGDVFHHQSAEYTDIGFDELTHFSGFQFNYLLTRARTSIPNAKVQIRSASNPGNIGNGWVKKRYIDPYQMSKVWTDPDTGKSMAFIPARLTDNQALMENDPAYMDRLRDLKKVSEKKYLALAEGRWDQPEGVYFTEWTGEPGFNVLTYRRTPDTHTLKFLSLDWGFADPACVLWYEVTPHGRIFVYREYYGTRLSPKELAAKIISMCPSDERYMYMSASPEIWGKRVETENGGEVIQELIQAGLGDRIIMQKANNARIPGWLKVREYLSTAPDGQPWMQISPVCENLIRTIPSAIHDEREGHSEDISGKVEDHACLIGESKVLTRQGEIEIMALVGTNGEIWTQNGWKPYSDCRMTRMDAQIVTLYFSNGESVSATPDHKVLTNQGWKELKNLNPSDLIMRSPSWKQELFRQRFRNLMEFVTIFVDSIFKKREPAFIGQYGNSTMAPYPMDSTSIILIPIGTTIKSRISNFLENPITASTMRSSYLQSRERRNDGMLLKKHCHSPHLGIATQRIIKGMLKLVKKHGKPELKKENLIKYVKCVALDIKHFILGILDFAILIARCVGSVKTAQKLEPISWSMIKNVGKRNVYNLEVEDTHSFAVNGGTIWHNCESLRYGLVTLNGIPRGTMNTPHLTNYEKIFGTNKEASGNMAFIPISGRGGYGR